MSATIGDSSVPRYRFDWADGSSRTTDDLPEAEGFKTEAIETLADLGRDDPDCEVTLIGFE